MQMQHRVKQRIKPLLFRDELQPRVVKAGPARGVRLLLNRRYNLQIELGLWESELNGSYRRWIGPSSVVYDIGAADGFTSLMYANLGATVIAFEPSHRAVALARRNLDLNPRLAERVTLVPSAYRHDDSLPEPSFVKIDVDGAELDVLRELGVNPQVIVLETHGTELERACASLLTGTGYQIRIVDNARWRRVYPEWRPIGHNRWLLAVLAVMA